MKRGTVILTPFPFTDLSGNKVRPAIIVSADDRQGNDVIIIFVSSVFREHAFISTDIPIKTDDYYFASTGLKTNSLIKVDKVATVDKKIILGEIGVLERQTMELIDQKLKIVFGVH